MRRLLAGSVVVASFAVTSPARAEIVPQDSIKGVKVDMTVDDVRALLGGPDRFRVVRNEIIGRVRQWSYGLTRVTFNSTAGDATVISVDTRSRKERTAQDIGVGSRRATVRRKVPNVRCLVEFSYDHCFVGRFRAGQIVTDFAIDSRGRVARVTLGRVID